MKEFNKGNGSLATVVCAKPGCKLNITPYTSEQKSARLEALGHEQDVSHETVVYYFERNKGVSPDDAERIKELTGKLVPEILIQK